MVNEEIRNLHVMQESLAENIGRIYCRLIRPELIGERLKTIPHEEVLDLAVIYYMRFGITNGEYLCVMVNESHIESWNISESQLKNIAWSNTLRDIPAVAMPLGEALNEFGGDSEGDSIYLISNEKRNLGAVSIVYPGVLARLAEGFGSDFYVLPSSVHECLALPCGEAPKISELREMVRTINRTELKNNEILSESVYRYVKNEERLIIDNT